MQTIDQNVDLVLTADPDARNHPLFKVLLPVIYSVILLVAFFVSYVAVFDKKIDLNGDDTNYYFLGKAIASGKGYTNIHEFGQSPHNHFPPGYPVIIAGICKFFSDDLGFVKGVNGFFLLASIVLLCLITWKIRQNIHLTFLVALLSLLNGHLLEYSVNTMSEVPFMFFSLLCILLTLNTSFEKPVYKNHLFGLLVICLSFTYHIRSTGIAMLIGVLAYLVLKKNWSYTVACLAGFVLLALPWYIRGSGLGGNSYLGQLVMKNAYRPELGKMELTDWLQRIGNNMLRYVSREIPSGIEGMKIDYDAPVHVMETIKGAIMVQMILFGLWLLKRKTENLLSFFMLSYMAILFLWPGVWVGVRFLLPLLPLLLFLLFNGLFETVRWTLSKLKVKNYQTITAVVILLVAAMLIKSYAHPIKELKKAAKNDFPANYKNYFDLAAWAKANTPDSSVFCCRKREMFFLYSGRLTTGYLPTVNTEEQLAWLQKGEIDYVVLDALGFADTERYLEPVIKKYRHRFKIVKHIKKPDTYLYQVLR